MCIRDSGKTDAVGVAHDGDASAGVLRLLRTDGQRARSLRGRRVDVAAEDTARGKKAGPVQRVGATAVSVLG